MQMYPDTGAHFKIYTEKMGKSSKSKAKGKARAKEPKAPAKPAKKQHHLRSTNGKFQALADNDHTSTDSNDDGSVFSDLDALTDARLTAIETSHNTLQLQMGEMISMFKEKFGPAATSAPTSTPIATANGANADLSADSHSNPNATLQAIHQVLSHKPPNANTNQPANQQLQSQCVDTAMHTHAIQPPSNDSTYVPLDDPSIIYRSDLWHEQVNTNIERWMLLNTLKEECYTQVPKLNYQIEIHLKAIDLLLQQRLDDTYSLLCDRIHFLRYQATHKLDEAVHFWDQLRSLDMPQKYKSADIAALLLGKRKDSHYTPKQQAYIQGQMAPKETTNDQAPQQGGPSSWGTTPGGRKGGRHKQAMWANKHGGAPRLPK